MPFGIGFFAIGLGVVEYWLSTLGGSSSDVGNSVKVDSAGNIYTVGSTESAGAGGSDLLLAKYNPGGAIQWQRVLGGAGSDGGLSVALDSANNVYVLGSTTSAGAGNDDFLIAKYNSAGTIQWQRVLGGATFEFAASIAIDSAGDVYVLGSTNSTGAGNYDFLLAKYNSSGTIQWQRILGGIGAEFGSSVAIDSANNVYVLGRTGTSPGLGAFDFLIAKYNSSGTIQWQRRFGGGDSDIGLSVALDSANNVYVLGFTASAGAGNDDFLIAKYDSSGTVQWQRVLGGANNERGQSVALDSANNVYVLGFTDSTGAGGDDFLIAKYNSSGTIQWQRVLGGSGSDRGNSIAIDSAGNLHLLGYTASAGAGSNDFLLAKLPNDGSLTGTYVLNTVNITYAASSLTAATSSLTEATPSLTASTSSLTDAASSLTSNSASLTEYLVKIG
jgi:uncharacterized delta-60 repeat protein